MALKLNGKPFDPLPTSPRVLTALKLLNSLPADNLLDIPELCKRTSTSRPHLTRLVNDYREAFTPFKLKVGTKVYFGSKAAIAELKRRIGDKA